MLYLILKIIGVSFITFNWKVHGEVSDVEYDLMPPLFHLDDFDVCMSLGESALYCTITVQLAPIDPEEPSQVWRIVQEIISNKKNFRHDRLRHGVCIVRSCPDLSGNVTIYKDNQELLREDLSRCYSKKYSDLGVKSVVTHMHCETQEPFYPIDSYDEKVALSFFVLFMIIIYGSFYEGLARYKTKEEYDRITSTTVGKVLSCFSIPKNWERLRKINDSPDAVSLRCINAVRFYNMCLVIMCHTCMIAYAAPVANPQFFETITDNPLNMIVVNGGFAIQTFFIMAGWLLSYHFLLTFERRKNVKYSYVVNAFINRYIRLTPCLLVIIAFSSSWLYHINRGPFWDKLVGTEYRHCRINWWTNLLYINNYYDSGHMCIQQSWYLASDTQLFVMSLIIVTFMWKYQHRIKVILGASLTIAVLIPAFVNYIYDYDIVVRQYPESLHNTMLDNREWHAMYASAYSNGGGYIIGLICGYLFYKYRGQKILTNKFHIAVWWIVVWGLPLSMIYIGIPIYKDDYKHSRIVAAIYASLARNIFGFGIALGLFGVSQGVGWFLRDTLNWLPLQALGRLSYSAFIVHVALIRVKSGLIRTPEYINTYILFSRTLGDITLAYIFALFLCLFVEFPVTALQKLVVPQLKETRMQKVDDKRKNNDKKANGNNTTKK